MCRQPIAKILIRCTYTYIILYRGVDGRQQNISCTTSHVKLHFKVTFFHSEPDISAVTVYMLFTNYSFGKSTIVTCITRVYSSPTMKYIQALCLDTTWGRHCHRETHTITGRESATFQYHWLVLFHISILPYCPVERGSSNSQKLDKCRRLIE
jgi:hypothetical protein